MNKLGANVKSKFTEDGGYHPLMISTNERRFFIIHTPNGMRFQVARKIYCRTIDTKASIQIERVNNLNRGGKKRNYFASDLQANVHVING